MLYTIQQLWFVVIYSGVLGIDWVGLGLTQKIGIYKWLKTEWAIINDKFNIDG